MAHTQTYDLDYRLTNIQVGGLLNRTYGYDPVNNITSIVAIAKALVTMH